MILDEMRGQAFRPRHRGEFASQPCVANSSWPRTMADEIDGVGPEVEASPAIASPIAGRQRKGRGRGRGGSVQVELTCHACTECDGSRTFMGVSFCQPCIAGVRARHRQLKAVGGKDAVDSDKNEMLTTPETWRPKVAQFTAPGGNRAQARAKGPCRGIFIQ